MQSLDHLYQSHLRWHFLRQVKIPRAGWGLLDQSLWRWCLRVIVFKQHLQQFVSMLKCKRRTSFFLDWFVQQVPLHHSTRHTREFNKHSLITLCHGVAHKILTVAFAHRSYIAFFLSLLFHFYLHIWASLVAQTVKHLPTMWATWVRSLGQEDPLEKEMATHSRILAWKIPWTEDPGRLQSMGSQRVGYNWAISLHLSKLLFSWR